MHMHIKCDVVTHGWAVMVVVSHIWRVTGTVYCYGNLCTSKSPCFLGLLTFFVLSGLFRDAVCLLPM
jgi:hypothetical protein